MASPVEKLLNALLSGNQEEQKAVEGAYAVAAAKMAGIEAGAFAKVYATLKPNQQSNAAQAFGLIAGFAVIHWSLRTPLREAQPFSVWGEYFYLSGTTFFTLGYGDVTPLSRLGRLLAEWHLSVPSLSQHRA